MRDWPLATRILIKWPAELIGTVAGELTPLLAVFPAIGAGWLTYQLIMLTDKKSERANWRYRLALAVSIVVGFWVSAIFYQAFEEMAWTIIESHKHL